MRTRSALSVSLLALATLSAACGSSASTAAPASPSPRAVLRPTVVSQNKLPSPAMIGTFDLARSVVDYPAGSFTVKHTHAGPVLISVIDGELTMHAEGSQSTVAAGKGFTEIPGKVYQGGNNGTGKLRWVSDVFVPKGANPSDPIPGAAPIGPPVTPTYTYRFKDLTQTALYDLVQLVQDFEPGAWTPKHKHGGVGLITVIEGELTVRSNGSEKVYKAGDSFMEEVGQIYEGGNSGTRKARNVASFLLPSGAPMTTSVQ